MNRIANHILTVSVFVISILLVIYVPYYLGLVGFIVAGHYSGVTNSEPVALIWILGLITIFVSMFLVMLFKELEIVRGFTKLYNEVYWSIGIKYHQLFGDKDV